MDFNGIIVGAATFLIIGLCHPLVIKTEYKYGKGAWWIFAVAGTILGIFSLIADNTTLSTVCGAGAFSFYWGIGEMFEQEKRVLKGWFPENPKRSAHYEARRKATRIRKWTKPDTEK